MKRGIHLLYAAIFTVLSSVAAFGCAAPNNNEGGAPEGGIVEQVPPEQQPEEPTEPTPSEQQPEEPPVSTPPVQQPVEPPPPVQVPQQPQAPQKAKAKYVEINADRVNVRSGAGTGYTVLGSVHKGEIYVYSGQSGNWIKTSFKNKDAYIYADYCTITDMEASTDKRVEKVIAEGGKCLGVQYVYGATRYLDENGRRISGFTPTKFDCSSLMQYIFKLGADKNLKLTTRTQIYQGTTIKASQIRRGDLLFFTNESRKNNVGIERVGHVALYLGDNYILHTYSDYARIEHISQTRWNYYIQAQRIF